MQKVIAFEVLCYGELKRIEFKVNAHDLLRFHKSDSIGPSLIAVVFTWNYSQCHSPKLGDD